MDFDNLKDILEKNRLFNQVQHAKIHINAGIGEQMYIFALVIERNPYPWVNQNLGGRGRKYQFLEKENIIYVIFTKWNITLVHGMYKNTKVFGKCCEFWRDIHPLSAILPFYIEKKAAILDFDNLKEILEKNRLFDQIQHAKIHKNAGFGEQILIFALVIERNPYLWEN